MPERIEIPETFPAAGGRQRPARRDHGRRPWARRGHRPRVLARRRQGGARRADRARPQGRRRRAARRDARVQRRRPRRRLQRGRRRRHRRRVGRRRRVDLQRRHLPDRRRTAGDRAGGVARRDRRQPHRRVPRRPRRGPRDGRGRAPDLHRLGARRTTAQGTHAVQRVEGGPHRHGQGAGARPRTGRASPSTSCRRAGSIRRSPTGSPTTSGWPSRSSQHTALRRWGRSADLAGAYQFLASDASAFVTGTVIHVDGGYQLV